MIMRNTLLLLPVVVLSLIEHANYNNAENVPRVDYDRSKCPNTTVHVEIGMFYIALVGLGKFQPFQLTFQLTNNTTVLNRHDPKQL